jgi:hypothetical protein
MDVDGVGGTPRVACVARRRVAMAFHTRLTSRAARRSRFGRYSKTKVVTSGGRLSTPVAGDAPGMNVHMVGGFIGDGDKEEGGGLRNTMGVREEIYTELGG